MGLGRGPSKEGRVILDEPSSRPDGTRVEVGPTDAEGTIGLREEDWPIDAEGFADLVARMDASEADEMSPEEESDLEVWRRKVKDYTIARMDERIEGLFP